MYTVMNNAMQMWNQMTRDYVNGLISDETNIYDYYTKDGFEKFNSHVLPIGSKKHEFVSFMPSSKAVEEFVGNFVWFSCSKSIKPPKLSLF